MMSPTDMRTLDRHVKNLLSKRIAKYKKQFDNLTTLAIFAVRRQTMDQEAQFTDARESLTIFDIRYIFQTSPYSDSQSVHYTHYETTNYQTTNITVNN